MNNRWITILQTIVLMVILLTTGRVFEASGEVANTDILNTKQLLSAQSLERSRALEGLTAQYREVCAALLKALEEASVEFRTDRRYHSPLHSTILAVDVWQVIDADELLLSMVDYELDMESLQDGMNVFGDYFIPQQGHWSICA